MARHTDIEKILIIGSGPIIIGQGSEFDYSIVQACEALRSQGYRIVLVNSNPSAISTDPGMAEVTYVEPLTAKVLTEIIDRERPDALLPNLGGQSGLNLTVELGRLGILEKYGVKVIGVTVETIEKCEDREAFRNTMVGLGLDVPKGRTVKTVSDAENAAEALGFPVAIRVAYTVGGSGGGLVYNVEELRTIAARGLAASLINQVRVEASVMGWEELELEVVRDADNRILTVCLIENVDPMGIHTGDSCCTIPPQTISPELQQRLEEKAHTIVQALEVVGGVNIQFAHDPATGQVVVIEINPRATRSSALASKAAGFPIARVSALLAGGMTLDEIPYGKDGSLDRYVPSNGPVAVKMPRWAFKAIEGARDELGTQMRSVGEVMGLGRTYKEAFQKAIRSLDNGRYGLGFAQNVHALTLEDLYSILGAASSERPFQMYEALRKGADIQTLHEITHIKPWFIEQMKELVVLEEKILTHRGQKLPDDLLTRAKLDGFGDRYLAGLIKSTESAIREQRLGLGLALAWETIPVSGETGDACHYSTYHAPDRVPVSDRKKIMVLGSGPNRIGQGMEFDSCCMQAAAAIRAAGYESIMINCNPGAVSTDYHPSDKLYFEPLTVENILGIYEKERPEGVLIQFGGQRPLDMAGDLATAGVHLLGASPDSIDLAQDRERFRQTMRRLGIPQPESIPAGNLDEAIETAHKIGYPLMVRLPEGSNGRRLEVVQDDKMLRKLFKTTNPVASERPVIIDRFLDNAIEAEVDAISDGTDAFVPAVMEHIELAGIHSGDSACVLPPISIAPKHIETIREYTRKIAVALNAVGLMNVQYAIFENTVYVLEAKPWASRTVPLASRVCNVPLARLAARVLLGESLSELEPRPDHIPYFGVKEAVFPFNMFPEVDPVLGLEMHSTGEVLGLADNFGRAFFKAQEATQSPLPVEGTVLFTIADRDKTAALEPVRLFRDLGFHIMTTKGTHQFLMDHDIETEPVQKIEYGRPNLVDAIKNGEVHLMVNTSSGRESSIDTSEVRKTAIKYKIPFVTTTAAAIAAAKGIAARKAGIPKVRPIQEYYENIRC